MSELRPMDYFWDAAPCGFLSTDRSGLIQAINATMLAWIGCDAEAVIGVRRFIELLTPGGRMYHDALLLPRLLMAGEVHEVALDLQRDHAPPLAVFCNARLQRDGDRETIVLAMIDATERRRYERDLLAANRSLHAVIEERNRLLGMVVHDLRTPLGGIMGLAGLLVDHPWDDEAREYLDLIQSTGTSMLALIDDLLDVSSAESGVLRMDPVIDDLCTVVRQALLIFTPTAAAKGSTIEARIPAQTLSCSYDPARILQALGNVLSNAVKFSPAKSTVILSVERVSQSAIIAVADHGPGIAESEVQALFEPFATGRARPTGGERSTGLGLSIVWRIAEAHQGTVEVQPRPGGGTVFRIVLPLAVPSE